MERIDHICGVILAGGNSSRFGSNKALAVIDGQPMIHRIADTMAAIFARQLLSTNEPSLYTFLDWPTVGDHYRECGPLAGIHAALHASPLPEIFLVGCDMPFISPALIRAICAPENRGIVVPRTARGMEPLFGRYHKNILPALEEALAQGERRLHSFIMARQPSLISEDELRQADPQLVSFKNINHQHELPATAHATP